VVRAGDQMDVLIELFDVDVVANQLVVNGALPSVRITFGSQHTAEEMFDSATPTVPTTAIASTSAGTSALVVPVESTVPFTFSAIIDLAEEALRVQSVAGAPDGTVTALEIPAGLVLSPAAGTTATAATTPFTVGDTTEVWVARLEQDGEGVVELAAVAVTSPADLLNDRIPDAAARNDIVDATTGGDPGDDLVTATRLWLSSSGAFARLRGAWPTGVVTAWRQRIAAGRDLHVEVTTSGYLAPFGHRAAVTEIADRNFFVDTGGGATSVLQVRRYLTLIDDVWDLGAHSFTPDGGRGLPFVSVRAVVDDTIPVALVPVVDTGGAAIPGVFDVTRIGNAGDLKVSYVATDRDGNEVSFSLPATFIEVDVAHDPAASGTSAAKLVEAFNSAGRAARRDTALRGQPMAFADPVAAGSGTTTKRTYDLGFELQRPVNNPTSDELAAAARPAFAAAMKRATVLDDLVGPGSGKAVDAFEVALHPRWLAHGNETSNFDLSYLSLTQSKFGTVGGGQPVSAVFAVEFVAEVFNQTAGVGPDLPSASSPWDPSTALGPASKVLGSISLADLIDLVPFADLVPGFGMPGTEVSVEGDTVTVVFSFRPKLATNTALGFIARPSTTADVVVTTSASLSGATPATASTEMTVREFDLVFPPGDLVGIITLDVKRMQATIDADGALAVDIRIVGWSVGDSLGFLQPLFDTLADLVGFQVEPRSDGIGLGNAKSLPDIGFGMLELRNVHVDIGLDLSLTGGPTLVHVGLGSAASPVEAQLGTLGATFFVELDLEFSGSDTSWRVEAGVSIFIEYGFDAVVVSAAVRLRVGCSFVFDKGTSGSSVKVSGAVALEGEVSVLGLLSVSAAIVGTVTYNSDRERIVVRGEIHWAVDTPLGGPDGTIPIGSTEFDLGDGAQAAVVAAAAPDTTSFGDLYSSADWSQYSAAFA
jgi:hypothetical protein